MGIYVLHTMFGKGNCLAVSKRQKSCFYHNYFKNYKLLNTITPPPPKKMMNMVRTISLCKLACNPGVTLPPCRGLWGTLHIGDDIDCNTCPHPEVPRVESHLFTVGGFLGNSKGMAWKTESIQNMGV